jgi:hypothetical protein
MRTPLLIRQARPPATINIAFGGDDWPSFPLQEIRQGQYDTIVETLIVSRGTERCYGAGGEDMATSSLHLTMECRDAPAKRLEQVARRPGPK